MHFALSAARNVIWASDVVLLGRRGGHVAYEVTGRTWEGATLCHSQEEAQRHELAS